jgi:hypothetical protein
MTSHRFGIGEGVTYSEKRFPTGIWIAELIVVEQLSRDGAPGYRLLAQDGATEYVLGEHELSPSSEKRNDHSARGPDRSSPTQLALGVVSPIARGTHRLSGKEAPSPNGGASPEVVSQLAAFRNLFTATVER